MLSLNSFSQVDTTKTCIPNTTLREAAKDLIRYDECRFEVKLLNKKIEKLQTRDTLRMIMIDLLGEKNSTLEYMVIQKDKQIVEYDKLTKDLTKEVKQKRNSNVFWKITTGVATFFTAFFALR
jgi:hypothetical protein